MSTLTITNAEKPFVPPSVILTIDNVIPDLIGGSTVFRVTVTGGTFEGTMFSRFSSAVNVSYGSIITEPNLFENPLTSSAFGHMDDMAFIERAISIPIGTYSCSGVISMTPSNGMLQSTIQGEVGFNSAVATVIGSDIQLQKDITPEIG